MDHPSEISRLFGRSLRPEARENARESTKETHREGRIAYALPGAGWFGRAMASLSGRLPALDRLGGDVALGDRVALRPPQPSDFPDWADLRRVSRSFLEPWEPTWPRDALSRPAFIARLKAQAEEWHGDRAYHFLIFRQLDGQLLGGLSLTNVRRGVAQAGTLGYWIGVPYQGQGYMSDALQAVSRFAFERLRLHRLEAACLPHNVKSRAALARTGFREEGFAPLYLKINGRWQDHVLYARINPAHEPKTQASRLTAHSV